MTGFRNQSDNIPVIDKSPNAVLDYSEDWSAWLAAGETIASNTVTVDMGLTKQTVVASPGGAATMITVWLAGGTVGTSYLVTVEIVTSSGRTDDRSFRVRCVLR